MADGPKDPWAGLREWLANVSSSSADFDDEPLSRMLARNSDGHYVLPNEAVPALFFNDGPKSASAIRAYLRSDRDPAPLEEYGGALARRAGVITPDGLVDLVALDVWEARYSGALSALPGLKSKLDVAREAQIKLDETTARAMRVNANVTAAKAEFKAITAGDLDIAALDDWEARHAEFLAASPELADSIKAIREANAGMAKALADKEAALDYIRLSPAMLYVDHDPMTATEKLFGLPDTIAAMRALLERIGGNQPAVDGLHKAVVDYITQRVAVNGELGTHYLKFFARHEAALALLFDDTKMQTFRNVAADIERSLLTLPPDPVEPPPPVGGWRAFLGRRLWGRK